MATVERGGASINYTVAGTGPTVLLSHGFASAWQLWEPQLAALAAGGYQAVAWDVRGHGGSVAGEDPAAFTIEATLDDMEAILAAVGAERAVLGGLSLGGYLSQLYRLRRPEQVAGLILCDTGPGFRNPAARAGWNAMAERFAEAYEQRGIAAMPVATRVAPEVHRSGGTGLAFAARGILIQHDSSVMDNLSQVDIPTLILVGAEDTEYLTSGEVLAAKIAGSEHHVVAEAGHSVNLDQPDRVNHLILEFLERIQW